MEIYFFSSVPVPASRFHGSTSHRLAELERHVSVHDQHIQSIFEAIHQLISIPKGPKKKIGFELKESVATYGKESKKVPSSQF
jgi:hypothetical protein